MLYKKDLKTFHEIEHTADIGLKIEGSTLPLFFANAAFGFYHLLYESLEVPCVCVQDILLQENALHHLLVAWLSELNYLLNIDHFVTNEIRDLTITERDKKFDLHAILAGDKNITYLTRAKFEIKAVTYHQLKIDRNRSGYRARIFFDI